MIKTSISGRFSIFFVIYLILSYFFIIFLAFSNLRIIIKTPHITVVFIWQFYVCLLRETLLKKGSPSNSLPKTFSINFSPDGALPVKLLVFTFLWSAPSGEKFY